MFQIEVTRFWWILDDGKDDPSDQCLHGHVRAMIGNETLEDDCAVSSTGLLLLRTLTEDHIELNIYGNQMLPNHGFYMYACDSLLQNVQLDGDPYGTDWAVRHDGDMVELETMSGTIERVPFPAYREQVLKFVERVEDYYRSSLPKETPEEDYIRNGFIAFWNEWHRRRENENRRILP